MPDGAHHGTGTRNDETRVGLEPAVEGILDDEDELDGVGARREALR